jgi:hypothetical protein
MQGIHIRLTCGVLGLFLRWTQSPNKFQLTAHAIFAITHQIDWIFLPARRNNQKITKSKWPPNIRLVLIFQVVPKLMENHFSWKVKPDDQIQGGAGRWEILA